jgi:hypothetical protein
VPMGSSAEAGAAALAGGPDSGTAAQRAGMGGGAAGSVLTSPTIGGGSKAAPGAAAPGISASTSVASIASAESLEAGAVIRLPGTGAGSAPTVPVFTAAPAKGVAAIGGADPNTAYAAVTIGLAHQ